MGIFIVSLAAIGWIISRKFVYLKKLNPEVVDNVSLEESFLAEFFPGLAERLNGSKLRQFRLNFLAEFEKFLRKMRLLSLKFDAATNSLIHQVRKSAVHHEGVISDQAAAKAEQAETLNGNGKEKDWEEEEHKLIIQIAKNPKEGELYKKLGAIYMKIGNWPDAIESFKKALEFNPQDEIIKNKLERISKKLEKMPA